MLKARSRFIPAFVTHALRPALARLPTWATNSCKNPPPLASKALPAPARAILRGGGPLLSSAPKMSMSSTAAVANPLMVQDHFPRYSEVSSCPSSWRTAAVFVNLLNLAYGGRV